MIYCRVLFLIILKWINQIIDLIFCLLLFRAHNLAICFCTPYIPLAKAFIEFDDKVARTEYILRPNSNDMFTWWGQYSYTRPWIACNGKRKSHAIPKSIYPLVVSGSIRFVSTSNTPSPPESLSPPLTRSHHLQFSSPAPNIIQIRNVSSILSSRPLLFGHQLWLMLV